MCSLSSCLLLNVSEQRPQKNVTAVSGFSPMAAVCWVVVKLSRGWTELGGEAVDAVVMFTSSWEGTSCAQTVTVKTESLIKSSHMTYCGAIIDHSKSPHLKTDGSAGKEAFGEIVKCQIIMH